MATESVSTDLLTRLIASSLLIAALSGCTRPDHARRLLESQGFREVQITGYRFWGCSDDDVYQTGFKAVGPTGAQVSGVVCEGFLFKNATVRFD